ncbi:family 10 glycosylhydrolase [Carboxylicivirga taeanensis]|uniref:family 10 glycosylhydrolase n=1 Tax=Carboxylicivirga taeanensis TaxID=1416875 RepID=UPI003F6DFD94
MKKLILLILVIWVCQIIRVSAQSPKREMRASWLTTVYGLDWPQQPIPVTNQAYYISQQKSQLVSILDNLKAANMNTVFFQVRSECDAMYQSSYEPWSSYLVETRGANPGYDPLAFAIEEAHKRGMELHAWLNPYRFETQVGKYKGKAGDYRQTNPEWVLEYPDKADGGKNVSILDPGRPGVRKRIVDIVKEILSNYDVDGITFDDYFYAYGGTPDNLDLNTQNLHKPAGMDLHDWRRDNVNKMVADVYQAIQSTKPWVTFGLSTFGIWTTDQTVAAKEGLTLPQGIKGLDTYKSIYCDPVAWLRDGSVDYISPQLYWPTTSIGQDYDVLSPWWSDVCGKYHKHLYVSHSLSDLEASSYSALKSGSSIDIAMELNGMSMLEYLSFNEGVNLKSAPTEYGQQIQINRAADKMGAPGSVFFRASNFYTQGFVNYLKTNEYRNKSLAPAINWKTAPVMNLPSNIQLDGQQLVWESVDKGMRYVIYAVPNEAVGGKVNYASPEYLLDITYTKSFDLANQSELIATHQFAVATLDRYGNESSAVMMGQNPGNNLPASLLMPENGQSVFLPFSFRWEEVADANGYHIEIANDISFSDVIYKRELSGTDFKASNVNFLVGNTYYWRVYSRSNGVVDEVSETRSFTVIEAPKCVISSPANNDINESLTPHIAWEKFGDGYTYILQVSSNSSFSSFVFENADIGSTSIQIPANTLLPYSTYFVRVKAVFEGVESAWSDVVQFSTVEEAPNIPVILSPTEGQNIGASSVEILIQADPKAASFRVELSERPDFHFMYLKVLTLDAFTYKANFEKLDATKYYVRVRANYGKNNYTAWSEVRSFERLATNTPQLEGDMLSLYCPGQLSDSEVIVNVELPEETMVNLSLYNISGAQVMLLESSQMRRGKYEFVLPADQLQRGMYILSLKTGLGSKTLKIVK